MKRILLSVFAPLMLIVLSSCETHIGDNVIKTPWWVVLVILGVYLVLHITIKAILMSKKYFVCKDGSHRFKPKWYSCLLGQFLFETIDDKTYYTLKCPECGRRVQAYKDENQEN